MMKSRLNGRKLAIIMSIAVISLLLMMIAASLPGAPGSWTAAPVSLAQEAEETPQPPQPDLSDSAFLADNPELMVVLLCSGEDAQTLMTQLLTDSNFLAANPELKCYCRHLAEQKAQANQPAKTVDSTPLCQCLESLVARCSQAAMMDRQAEQIMHDSATLAANPELKCHCRCLAERNAAAKAAMREVIYSRLGTGAEPFVAQLESLIAQQCAAQQAAAAASATMHDSKAMAANPELKCHCQCTARQCKAVTDAIAQAISDYLASPTVHAEQNPELAAAARCQTEALMAMRKAMLQDSAFLAANPELIIHCNCAQR